ncbi:MAG: hypothetical protein PW789_06345 [Edaphobacter sp.]|uniref:hypothetical protein n=1 Tax=Edaphobacter sp. TaxID=1934404 RepID=UPI0023A60180|nr:hypothetical protein [Edaphobacter sp.]MDE1176214.1 hypothetical protein [Edaphobacter sp.]
MNPVIWGIGVVLLLGFLFAVTVGKIKWRRSELDPQPGALPGNKGRVSGGDD